jgi:hypothetical protein
MTQSVLSPEAQRVFEILNCEEAKDRPTVARHVAFRTPLTLEQARKLLAASPPEPGDRCNFAAAMAKLGNPKVGVDMPSAWAAPMGGW